MNFLFLMPVLGQPRYAKRISMLQAEGVGANALYFERDYHSGRLPTCSISGLGKVEHGRYFKRIFTYLSSLPQIRRHAKKSSVIYTFELDLAFLAFIATVGLNVKQVVEIGDVREVQTSNSVFGRILRLLERALINRVSLLVVTAPRFYSEYYIKWLGVSTKCVVIENKLDLASLSDKPRPVGSVGNYVIRIGYFGLLRCNWSADSLLRLASEFPDKFSVVLAGRWMLDESLLEKFKGLDNVSVLGEYKSPKDLNYIYSQVDVVWSCYEPLGDKVSNLHWARTNRFYEALYFNKPLIARSGSSDGDFVSENNLGLALGSDCNLTNSLTPLSKITAQQVLVWLDNIKNLHPSCFLYTDEVKQLLNELDKNDEL